MKVPKVLNVYFHLSYLYLLIRRKQLFTGQVEGTNREKYFMNHNIKAGNAKFGGK